MQSVNELLDELDDPERTDEAVGKLYDMEGDALEELHGAILDETRSPKVRELSAEIMASVVPAGVERLLTLLQSSNDEEAELAAWADFARSQGLAPLIETHGAEDRSRLEDRGWELIGVNNRDLRTFEVSLEHSIAALPGLPGPALKVAESGIGSGEDVARLAAAGFDAFLVGESLLLAGDPAAKLGELVSSPS